MEYWEIKINDKIVGDLLCVEERSGHVDCTVYS